MPLDLALLNARVRTLDPDRPSASALGVQDGRIAVVGDDAEVRALAGPATETIDLAGAAVVPGLIDAHTHPFKGAIDARGADLTGARTIDEVRRRLTEERARIPDGAWVLGFGLGYDVFAATGARGALIEDAVGGAPAFLLFMDLHTGLASPRALELAGVTGPVAFDEQSEVVCEDGQPTGELLEWAAMDLVRGAIPELTDDDRHRLYVAQLRRFAALGITGTHAMDGSLATHDTLRRLEADGDLRTRVVAPFWVTPDTPRDEWVLLAGHRDASGERWRGGVAKFFVDGVIDSGTGWLVEPDTEGDGTLPFWPDPARYREAVGFFAGHGFQCATHACGDRAVREALDAYRATGAVGVPVHGSLRAGERPGGRGTDGPPSPASPGPSPDARVQHRVEHIETIQPEDLPRFAAEGVTASMQTQHMMDLAPDRSDNWSRRLGPDRCDRAFLTRAIWESGALVALGSDWPVVGLDPREGMASARLRRDPSDPGRAPYDDQAIDGLQALLGYTRNAARAVGEDHRRGTIRPGFDADLTVLAEDPVDVPAEDLMGVPVVLTVVAGEVVHRAG
ncbi:amidohydrolase [Patulibacter sp.]|uniref:amidohydrolase n=1 Tax=Patulibacter sp. TaxID=1912859 RepID=UPI0027189C8E|nr:amidohydrolase family protein [Patulibacter sp.]MDO9410636.1 amidohydrolase family protein [Patulibacter sp.]